MQHYNSISKMKYIVCVLILGNALSALAIGDEDTSASLPAATLTVEPELDASGFAPELNTNLSSFRHESASNCFADERSSSAPLSASLRRTVRTVTAMAQCSPNRGVASWYGPGLIGRPTASGERFTSRGLTAAHRTLPMGTRVRVTNTANGRVVVVRINDRGPFERGRILDLSEDAMQALGVTTRGRNGRAIGTVNVEMVCVRQ